MLRFFYYIWFCTYENCSGAAYCSRETSNKYN